jgi:hypothetical protein
MGKRATIIKKPLDDETRAILKKLLANPYGTNENQLWGSSPRIKISKEPFLKRLSALEKAGAVKVTPEGNQKIVTLVPEIANKILAENLLTFPSESLEEQQEAEKEPNTGESVELLQPDMIPSWFRIQRTVMERIENLVSEGESISKDEKRFDEFKLWLDNAICANSLFVSAKICSEAGRPWDYVLSEIMKGTGEESEVLVFLLYEVRTALLLKCYKYLQEREQRIEMEPRLWVDLVYAFFERWKKITTSTRYSGSLEDRLAEDVFLGFVLKEDDLDSHFGEEYIVLIYDAIKWHALTRTSHANPLFDKEYKKAIDAYEEKGRKLMNKANQHKQYRVGRHAFKHSSTLLSKEKKSGGYV